MSTSSNTNSRPEYFNPSWIKSTDTTLEADVCVYGGTAGGVVAAVAAAKRGKKTILLHPGQFLGGMTTGGLSWTDYGKKHVIGGMSRQFYTDLGKYYGKDEEWRFEPRHASREMQALVDSVDLPVHYAQFIESAQLDGQRITSITMLGGLTVKARIFIDASYEGDLMAKAGVSYTVGREPNHRYEEELNGVQVRNQHQFSHRVDPYKVEGDPSSGLLPQVIDRDQLQHIGEGDKMVQAYNFRVCMTDDPDLKIPWQKPANYDPDQYIIATRWYRSEKDMYNEHVDEGGKPPRKFDILPNKTANGYHKTDTNNHGPVSSDFIGANHTYPEASYEEREQIFQAHVTYQQGYYWHVANCPEIPQAYREAYGRWGLPNDEFLETAHWPHQLYVREARRMISGYVITEHDCKGRHPEDSVGMGSYTMDSHNCCRFVTERDGQKWVLNDGDVQVPPTDPYPVSYRAIVPRQREADNLFVPWCYSASHIAYGSARMEPVGMVLGQSAAIAAALCIDNDCNVQDLPYNELEPELVEAKQVLR